MNLRKTAARIQKVLKSGREENNFQIAQDKDYLQLALNFYGTKSYAKDTAETDVIEKILREELALRDIGD